MKIKLVQKSCRVHVPDWGPKLWATLTEEVRRRAATAAEWPARR